MQKTIPKPKEFLNCENYVSSQFMDKLEEFLEITATLKISLLVIDDLKISERDSYLKSEDSSAYSIISAKKIYDVVKKGSITEEELKNAFKSYLQTGDNPKNVIATRKTMNENSIDKIKKQLGSIRNQYEVISLFSNNKKTLKWAAQDRRIDYITVDILSNSGFIDQPLCSVIKQNNKRIEVVLSSILRAKSDRELSEILRKGKKLMRLIASTNTPFILTMNPDSHMEFRTGSQMRLLGSLLGVPYNKTQSCVFDKQIQVIISNMLKLHDSHIAEGIKEA